MNMRKFFCGKNFKLLALVLYICLVFIITLVVYRGSPYAALELNPIASYIRALNAPPHLARIEIRNAVLNVLMFTPFGFLPPLVWRKFSSPIYLLPTAFAFTLTIELTQLITGRGVFSTEDLLHNTLGAGIGLLSYTIFIKNKR